MLGTGWGEELLHAHPPALQDPALAPPAFKAQVVMSGVKRHRASETSEDGVLPKGGAIVKEKTEHIRTVTVRGRPHAARAVNGDESSTRPVSAACGGGAGGRKAAGGGGDRGVEKKTEK